jgi:hypothetical protein
MQGRLLPAHLSFNKTKDMIVVDMKWLCSGKHILLTLQVFFRCLVNFANGSKVCC